MAPMPLEWTLLVLAVLQTAGAQICGDVKAQYKTQGCCNQSAQEFDMNPLQDEYAFSLTKLSQTDTANWPTPNQGCFYPVTLPALINSDHRNYSWVPHDSTEMGPYAEFLANAPSGAFVYEMADGSFEWDAIASVAIDATDAALIFRRASDWTHQTTFQEVNDATATDYSTMELKSAISCFESSVSLSAQPFNEYSKFVWTAGPFSLAGKNSGCGAFVYQKTNGGIVYHAC